MVVCFVPQCSHNNMRERCSFYRFPKDEALKRKWIAAIRREDRNPSDDSKICSCHFVEEKKSNGPTIFPWNAAKRFMFNLPEKATKKKKVLPVSSTAITNTSSTAITNTSSTVITDNNNMNVAGSNAEDSITEMLPEEVLNECNNKGCQTTIDVTDQACQTYPESKQAEAEKYFLERDVEKLKVENLKLKQQPFRYELIKGDDKLINFYTGIPNAEVMETFLGTFKDLKVNYIHGWQVDKISRTDQIFMTLIKLRLDFKQIDLSVRFNCSTGMISNIILTWIHVFHKILYEVLMDKVPTLEKNQLSLPEAFSQFPNCRMVIDCTEISVEIPTEMDKQKDTYSHYKHKNTLKGLVGVAPNGVITYCSVLYPGSLSDKEIVRHSGILNKFNAGDMILADKGFLIQDLLPPNVNLNIPPFLATPQFTPAQVEKTTTIAQARIHVERAIGRVKNFEILRVIPSSLRPYASKVWQVCCALTQWQSPVIKDSENIAID